MDPGREQQVQEEGEKGEIERVREDSETWESSEEGEKEVLEKEREVKVNTPVRRSTSEKGSGQAGPLKTIAHGKYR